MRKIYNEIILKWDDKSQSYITSYEDSYFIDDNESILKFGGGDSGGGGGATSTTNTVQKADPWSGQQPYLTYGFQQAQDQFNSSNPQYYPGSTVASLSPDTLLAQQLTQNRAINGSPIQNSANTQLSNTLNGDYLNQVGGLFNNPYQISANQYLQNTLNGDNSYGGAGFNAAYNAAANQIIPQVNSQFESANRSGSGLAATAQTQALGDAFAGLWNQSNQNQLNAANQVGANTNNLLNQYENEREKEMQGTMFTPTVADQDYQNISALGTVGSQQDAYNQALLQDQVNRFNFGQNLPAAKLSDYMNLIQGNYGGTTSGTSSSTVPLYSNSLASGLGMGLGGISLLSSLFGGGGGGITGLLGGLF